MKTKHATMDQNELTSLRAELKREKNYSAHLGAEVEKITEQMMALHAFFTPLFHLGRKSMATNAGEEYYEWKSGRLDLYRTRGGF